MTGICPLNSVYILVEVSLYFNYLVSVTAGGPVSPLGHMESSSTVDFRWFVAIESKKILY